MEISMFKGSSIDALRNRAHNFHIQDIEAKVIIQDNPNHWLQEDIIQIQQFHYRLIEGFEIKPDTKEEVKIWSAFLFKFFRHNYQLVWNPQDKDPYGNLSTELDKIE